MCGNCFNYCTHGNPLFPLTGLSEQKIKYYFSFLVRGGINEIFHARWELSENPTETMHALDINAAHAFAAFNDLPIGEYKVTKQKYHYIRKVQHFNCLTIFL